MTTVTRNKLINSFFYVQSYKRCCCYNFHFKTTATTTTPPIKNSQKNIKKTFDCETKRNERREKQQKKKLMQTVESVNEDFERMSRFLTS